MSGDEAAVTGERLADGDRPDLVDLIANLTLIREDLAAMRAVLEALPLPEVSR